MATQALKMATSELRFLCAGKGWRIREEICGAGPSDRPFEERHACYSISAVLSGTFTYRSHRGRVLMSPGALLVGQAGAPFSCSHDHGHGDRCVAFYLDDWWVEEFARELPDVTSTQASMVCIPPTQSLAPLLADVHALAGCANPNAGEELAFRLAAAALSFSSNPRVFNGAAPSDEKRIAAAVRLIEREIAEPLSLARIAGEVGMSRYHFLRTFRSITGQTPWHYILSRRLTLAAGHLSAGSLAVLDAALASGFSDLSEFTRRFHAHFGVTPGLYRRYGNQHPRSAAFARPLKREVNSVQDDGRSSA